MSFLKKIKKNKIELPNSNEDLKSLAIEQQKRIKRLRWQRRLTFILLLAVAWFALFKLSEAWWLNEKGYHDTVNQTFPTPSRKPIIREVQAAEIEKLVPVKKAPGDCEQYRSVVKKYFGSLTDEALFVASKEGNGCTANKSHKANTDGTWDYCIFQINNEPDTAKNIDLCVRRAFEKYTDGRIGVKNWSAFYAVCEKEKRPGLLPTPKYTQVIDNCS